MTIRVLMAALLPLIPLILPNADAATGVDADLSRPSPMTAALPDVTSPSQAPVQYYVDPTSGNDATTTPTNIATPFKTISGAQKNIHHQT